MPRVSRQQTDQNRIAIEEASARLFREQGIKAVSVADLMGAAGLTHGGFYGHFESKDALAAVACTKAFEQSAKLWQRRVADKAPAEARAALVDGYLSARHRNDPGAGCPIVGLASDVAREPAGKPVHAAYVDGLKHLLEKLEATQASGDAERDHAQALVQMATLVGSMVLARATRGDALSDAFLAAGRQQLLTSPLEEPAVAKAQAPASTH